MISWRWSINDDDFVSTLLHSYYTKLSAGRGGVRDRIVSALELVDLPRALLASGADKDAIKESLLRSIYQLEALVREYKYRLGAIDSDALLSLEIVEQAPEARLPITKLNPIVVPAEIASESPSNFDAFDEVGYIPLTLFSSLSDDDDDFDLPPDQNPKWGKTE